MRTKKREKRNRGAQSVRTRFRRVVSPRQTCLILGVVYLLGSLSPSIYAQNAVEPEQTIAEVRVVGNRRVRTEDILAQIHSRPGAVFNRREANEDARRVVQMSQVYDVQVEIQENGDQVTLVFAVQESQVIEGIAFVGNKHIKTKDLEKEIGFTKGDYLDLYTVRRGAEAIAEKYRKKGYYSVHVEVDEAKLRDELQVAYTITEGPKCRVEKITFVGNHSIRKGKLKAQIKTKAHFPIFQKGLLDDEKLEEDRLSIASYYLAEGYLDARVFVQKRFNDERTRAYVDFVIEEGDQYQIVAIFPEGNTTFTDEELLAALPLHVGQVLTEERKTRAEKKLKDMYGEKGYLYFRVNFVPEFTDRAGEIVLRMRINEGRAYRLGRLLIQGNRVSQDKIIRRDFDYYSFSPGLLYNAEAADRARRRLQGSGWYEKVTVEPLAAPGDPNSRDALVEVTEGLTGLVTFGVGIGSNNGVAGQLSIEERNFDLSNWPSSWDEFFSGKSLRGGGQLLRFDFFPGTQETRGRITFQEPYLFDQPYYLNVEAHLFKRYQESYLERRRGGGFTIGKRFDNFWNVDVGFNAEVVRVSDLDTQDADGDPNTPGMAVSAPREVQKVEGDNFLTSITLGLGRDTTDRLNRATEGYKFRASYEQFGAMGGDFTFGKVHVGGTHFQTLYEDLRERRTVLISQVRYNTIVGDAPVFEKFYAGGIGSVRGYDYRGISPRGTNPVTGREGNDPIGSDFLLLAGLEVNQPLYEETLFGKLFMDSALIDEGPWRYSVGVGVDIMIPQLLGNVPMQFNLAVPFNEDDQDETQVFSFTFGFRY